MEGGLGFTELRKGGGKCCSQNGTYRGHEVQQPGVSAESAQLSVSGEECTLESREILRMCGDR